MVREKNESFREGAAEFVNNLLLQGYYLVLCRILKIIVIEPSGVQFG